MPNPKTLTELFGLNTPAELTSTLRVVPNTLADQFIRGAFLESYADGVIKNQFVVKEYNDRLAQDQKIMDFVKVIDVDKNSVKFNGTNITNLVVPGDRTFQAAVVQCRGGRAQPRTKHVDKVNLFLNSLPSYIPSRMVPYLDVEFDVKRSNVSEGPNTAPTLTRFLMGNNPSELDKKLLSTQTRIDPARAQDGTPESRTFIGMEVFTSPQTLVNPKINETGGLKNKILDPFRPFMTLESAEISVQPEVGFFTKKRAKLSLKLHDRSRLSEISDMIRPQTYVGTNVWLTYGWIYPKTSVKSDPYGDFINGTMLVRECYGIVNCSYSFDQHGQASINLELFTKSVSELRDLTTTELVNTSNLEFSRKAEEVIRQIDFLLSDKSSLSTTTKEKLDQYRRSNETRELRVIQVLHAAEHGEILDVNDDTAKKLVDDLAKFLKTGKNYDRLRGQLKPLETSLNNYLKSLKDTDKIKKELKGAATNAVGNIINSIDKLIGTENGDYFISKIPQGSLIREKLKDFKGSKVVSFGTLVSHIILSSVNKLNAYESLECQIVFYNFNNKCGNFSGLNISEFPILLEELRLQLIQELSTTRAKSMSIEQLIRFIVTHQIEDPRNVASNFRKHYKSVSQSNDKLVAEIQPDKIPGQAEKNLNATKESLGIYKQPIIECHVEALSISSATTTSNNNDDNPINLLEVISSKPSKFEKSYGTMLRFHIFDKQLSAYPEEEEYDLSLTPINGGTQYSIKLPDNPNVTFSPKDVITRNIPTITFGANGTSVLSATVASQHEPMLAATQMLKPIMKPNNLEPNGSGAGGLPLRVIPSTLNTTMLGCPLIYPAQSFYFDFQTNTTLDNVYVLTHLTHHIAPGKFQTVCQFTPHDAYGKYESVVDKLRQASQRISLINTGV